MNNQLKPSDLTQNLANKSCSTRILCSTNTAVEVNGPSGKTMRVFDKVSSVESLIKYMATQRTWLGVIEVDGATIINTSLTRAEKDLMYWSKHGKDVKAARIVNGRRFDGVKQFYTHL